MVTELNKIWVNRGLRNDTLLQIKRLHIGISYQYEDNLCVLVEIGPMCSETLFSGHGFFLEYRGRGYHSQSPSEERLKNAL